MAYPHFYRWRQILFFVIGIGITLGLGMATPAAGSFVHLSRVFSPGVQYAQISSNSMSQEMQLGQEIDQQLHQQYRFDTDSRANAYVNRIGQHVASISDCPQFSFHYSIIQDDSLNAFATTGGYVYVNTGLLKAVDSESELAGVLGHETGHICNDDLIHKMRRAALEKGIISLAGLDHSTLVQLGTRLAFDLPNSRRIEYNADVKGQTYLEQAGYDRYGLVNFLQKLLKQPSQPAFLSTHPGTQERIAMLEKRIATEE